MVNVFKFNELMAQDVDANVQKKNKKIVIFLKKI